MTMNQEKKGNATFLKNPANERLPCNSATLPLPNLGVQATQPHVSWFYDEPHMVDVKFGGGVLDRPIDPALSLYCHF